MEVTGGHAVLGMDIDPKRGCKRPPEPAAVAGDNQSNQSPIERAKGKVAVLFGAQWADKVHYTHRMSFAHPVLYCRVCGYSATRFISAGLGRACNGEPQGTSYLTKRNKLLADKHPTTGHALGASVPLP